MIASLLLPISPQQSAMASRQTISLAAQQHACKPLYQQPSQGVPALLRSCESLHP